MKLIDKINKNETAMLTHKIMLGEIIRNEFTEEEINNTRMEKLIAQINDYETRAYAIHIFGKIQALRTQLENLYEIRSLLNV